MTKIDNWVALKSHQKCCCIDFISFEIKKRKTWYAYRRAHINLLTTEVWKSTAPLTFSVFIVIRVHFINIFFFTLSCRTLQPIEPKATPEAAEWGGVVPRAHVQERRGGTPGGRRWLLGPGEHFIKGPVCPQWDAERATQTSLISRSQRKGNSLKKTMGSHYGDVKKQWAVAMVMSRVM